MLLKTITIQKYRNFVQPQVINVEEDVTALVGKNEAGKTTILKALHRLHPANNKDAKFDLTTEYPRWRLARDRRADSNLVKTKPIEATFTLAADDVAKVEEILGVTPVESMVVHAAKTYDNSFLVWVSCDFKESVAAAAAASSLDSADTEKLQDCTDFEEVKQKAKELAKELKDAGEALRAKALTAFSNTVAAYDIWATINNDQEKRDQLAELIPRFFYFSSYNVLPGESDLTVLAEKISSGTQLTDEDRTVVALLAHAGEEPEDFMDTNYDSRKAELQAASVDLSSRAFEYWKQNEDLEVVFDTDNVVHEVEPSGNEVTHRVLKVELRDGRHGNVETNFSTRSTGFQWFFSFFAAFSEYQDSSESIIVLLDEPGTSLHGDAQRDFIRFIFLELGASKQTIYTTHSQHMVDPTKYEKIRAVHDRATRQDPDQGVQVTLADLSADKATILPLESALGYSISQHLFIGSGHHLVVEGSSDFVYLQRVTEHFIAISKTGLDPHFAVVPVGGADNIPAFVALMGRRLKVSALIDGPGAGSRINRVKAAAKHNGVPETAIIACSAVDSSLPSTADIEDLFDVDDYLKLYNWAFDASIKKSDLAATSEPIIKRLEDVVGEFDHALPAHTLTERRVEFFGSVKAKTVNNFEKLFTLLNATLGDS